MENIKTWKVEAIIVGTILYLPAIIKMIAGNFDLNELVAASAILFTFMHAQIANRMEEAQEVMTMPSVECWRNSKRFFFTKELLWIAYFILVGTYSAIIGSFVFVAYPFWRVIYREYRPKKAQQTKLVPLFNIIKPAIIGRLVCVRYYPYVTVFSKAYLYGVRESIEVPIDFSEKGDYLEWIGVVARIENLENGLINIFFNRNYPIEYPINESPDCYCISIENYIKILN